MAVIDSRIHPNSVNTRGIRVDTTVGKVRRQAYFKLEDMDEAIKLNDMWRSEAAIANHRIRLSTSRKPSQFALGLTALIVFRNRVSESTGEFIRVEITANFRAKMKSFATNTVGYDTAWRNAVYYYAEAYELTYDERASLINEIPPRDVFKSYLYDRLTPEKKRLLSKAELKEILK